MEVVDDQHQIVVSVGLEILKRHYSSRLRLLTEIALELPLIPFFQQLSIYYVNTRLKTLPLNKYPRNFMHKTRLSRSYISKDIYTSAGLRVLVLGHGFLSR